MKFTELEIHPDLMRAIDELGFTDLTPIQEKSLKPALDGRDIAGISQTGTGKTVAFLLPILHRIMTEDLAAPAALIIAPTRELCLQISEEAEHLTKHHPISVCAVYGGEGYERQEARLRENPAVIAATPGRLIDYIRQGKLNMGNLKFLVLDEADRMFDMGFIRDIRFIMKRAPEGVQTMLYSATLSYYVIRLAGEYMKDPEEVRIEAETVAIDKIEQQLLHLGRDEKRNYLANQILRAENPRAIVFTNLKIMVPNIVNNLRAFGIAAVGISSLLDQKKRVRLLKEFKLGKFSVLVATDVASRGLDVDDVTHVFNYDLPMDGESYVHRIGRTARAGKSGISISYCSESDYEALPKIERYLGQKIPVIPLDETMLGRPPGEFVPFGEPMRDGTGQRDRERDGRRRGPGGRHDRGRERRPRPAVERDREIVPVAVATLEGAAEGAGGEGTGGEGAGGDGRRRRRRRRGGRGGGAGAGGTGGEDQRSQAAGAPRRLEQTESPIPGRGSADSESIRNADRAALLSRRPGQPQPQTQTATTEGGRRRRRRRRGGRGQGEGERPREGAQRRDSGERGGRRRSRPRGPKKEEKKGIIAKILSIFKRS